LEINKVLLSLGKRGWTEMKTATVHNTRLTAPEIAALWTQYQNDTLAICFNKYAISKIDDQDVLTIYQYALGLAESHVESIKEFLTSEGFPIPHGFSNEDVNLEAARLYSDEFLLNYLYNMTLHGLTGYAVSLSTSSRPDIRKYYRECTVQTMELHERVLGVMQAKGLYTRPPYINPPEMVEFVNRENFLTGWFGERSPLNAIEITNITFNMNKTNLGKALVLGLSQVAKLEDVRNYMLRGTKISTKHTEVFNSLFQEDNLNAPISWDSTVTNSTEPPFSDRLIMFHTHVLTQAAVAFYGASLAVCMRKDLLAHYVRLSAELLNYAKDGIDLMINHGWLEKPPTADDRDKIAQNQPK
jgi:hypothetical protein